MRGLVPFALMAVVCAGCAAPDGPLVGLEEEAAGTAVRPAGSSFSLTELSTPSGGSGFALAVNSRGAVAGWTLGPAGQTRATLWQGRTRTLLPGLGGGTSSAEAINDRGDVAGFAETAAGDLRAVLWTDGDFIDLGTLGGDVSYARGINNRGDVVGASQTSSGELHAFLWTDGEMIDLGLLPGAAFSEAVDINDRGDVVGWSAGGSLTQRATLWRRGRVIDLGTLGFESGALAINAGREIVGASIPTTQNDARAVMWEGSALIDLGATANGFSTAYGINDRGQVVGATASPDCFQCPFVWEDGMLHVLPVDAVGTFGSARDINNRGTIAGFAGGNDGTVPVLWSAMPQGRVASLSPRQGTGPDVGVALRPRRRAAPGWAAAVCSTRVRIGRDATALEVAAGC